MTSRIAALGRRGILNPRGGDGHFSLSRHEPALDLAPFVERHWIVHWDLTGRPPFAQATLPYPCVNLVFGTHRPGLHGPATRRFVAMLEGEGWVVGTKFRPGGFRPFFDAPIATIADRDLAVAEAFGDAGAELERAVHAAPGDAERVALVETFLRARRPAPDPDAERAARIVALVEADPSTVRVDALAARAGLGVRALQRLFLSHVGLSPKWVIRRFRMHEAAERVASGASADWSRLAQDLGYCDQSHFIRDFRAQVGKTPTAYAAWCASDEARANASKASAPRA